MSRNNTMKGTPKIILGNPLNWSKIVWGYLETGSKKMALDRIFDIPLLAAGPKVFFFAYKVQYIFVCFYITRFSVNLHHDDIPMMGLA